MRALLETAQEVESYLAPRFGSGEKHSVSKEDENRIFVAGDYVFAGELPSSACGEPGCNTESVEMYVGPFVNGKHVGPHGDITLLWVAGSSQSGCLISDATLSGSIITEALEEELNYYQTTWAGDVLKSTDRGCERCTPWLTA